MKKYFGYELVPTGYPHCFNKECVRSEQCLRHLVAKSSTTFSPMLTIVNPNLIPEDTSTCPYFRPIKTTRVAWGVRKLFNKIPYSIATSMRRHIIAHFSKSTYYRIFRHERYLLPKEEAYIRNVFKQNSITEEPEFDKYTDEYIF